MSRSFLSLMLAAAITGLCACSSAKKTPPPVVPAPVNDASANLQITAGVHVTASIALPRGFAPIAGRQPLWLENGTEIGLFGTFNGHFVALGFSGPGWRKMRVLAAEAGPDAAEPGRIVDLAASPNRMTLAFAVAVAGQNRLDIVLRDLIANSPGHPIVSFDGVYDFVSLKWINNQTVGIVLHPSANQPPPPPAEAGLPPEPVPKPSEGLQLLVVAGPGSVVPSKLPCKLGVIDWNPTGAYGVSSGGPGISPAIIDRRRSACVRLSAEAPVHVLGWDPAIESSFLFVQPVAASHTVGVFEHDIVTGRERTIAVASGAAGYSAEGSVVALGNQKLTFKMVARDPFTPVIAEVAVFDPQQPEIDITQLGFKTVPPMLAASTIELSRATDRLIIQTFQPANPVAIRKILAYTMHADNAFQIAYGPARGVVETSWSPRGRWLAIVDGDAAHAALTVILPPA